MPSLNQTTGKAYWRSLDELTDSPQFRAFAEKEFADYAPELIQSPSRRRFMKLMGASVALAGVTSMTGCRRWPEKQLAPYAEPPAGHIPGVPVPYATSYEYGGVARPLLVGAYDGRPIKVEGNPNHPMSLGATDMICQASILEMWDPARSRYVLHKGEKKSWNDFAAAASTLKNSGGAGVAVLSEATASPSVMDMKKRLLATMPQARWFEFEVLNRDYELAGAAAAFGQPVRTHYKLSEADVIVVLDGDPLGNHPAQIRNGKEWARRRRAQADEKKACRMYVVEPCFTITGTNADRRLPARRQDVPQIAAEIEAGQSSNAIVADIIKDLQAAKGRSLVIVGESQPPAVHAAAHRINAALGNVGKTVFYTAEPQAEGGPQTAQITALVEGMNSGAVKTLIILGGNPVFNAPADLRFADAMKKVETTIHLSNYVDETSTLATWHVNRAHYLEAWGDVRFWDGSIGVQQPLILPLYNGKTSIEVIAALTGDNVNDGYEIVRRTWSTVLPANAFEKSWRKVLYQGFLENSQAQAVNVTARSGGNAAMAGNLGEGKGDIELVFRGDYKIYDGRFAPNGWLQENPDPVTKLTWDNAAVMDPATAAKLNVRHGEVIRIEAGERDMKVAVYVLPGGAPNSITVALGYGRTEAGYVGTGVGFDAYQMRTTGAMQGYRGVSVTKMGRNYTLATTQNHWAIDELGREEAKARSEWLVRELNVTELDHAQEALTHKLHIGIEHVPTQKKGNTHIPLQIFDEPVHFADRPGNQWGMIIDLSACIGCGACTVACQAENNIPVVGKQYVDRGREMHWIRVDRYFRGDPAKPETVAAVHQPMTCHHCETAPCESVCPVAATTHDTEGLNVMIYNRCVGTRYCSNNCPYKVRRFNYFDWNWKKVHSGDAGGFYPGVPDQQQREIDPIRQLGFNPEVTVRMRGVMEKCTFCTQRIKAVTIPARNEGRIIQDGEITPACAQTCPTDAIIFGDLKDAGSRVSQFYYKSQRAYQVLRELNTRPRLRYLARVTNSGVAAAKADSHHG